MKPKAKRQCCRNELKGARDSLDEATGYRLPIPLLGCIMQFSGPLLVARARLTLAEDDCTVNGIAFSTVDPTLVLIKTDRSVRAYCMELPTSDQYIKLEYKTDVTDLPLDDIHDEATVDGMVINPLTGDIAVVQMDKIRWFSMRKDDTPLLVGEMMNKHNTWTIAFDTQGCLFGAGTAENGDECYLYPLTQRRTIKLDDHDLDGTLSHSALHISANNIAYVGGLHALISMDLRHERPHKRYTDLQHAHAICSDNRGRVFALTYPAFSRVAVEAEDDQAFVHVLKEGISEEQEIISYPLGNGVQCMAMASFCDALCVVRCVNPAVPNEFDLELLAL